MTRADKNDMQEMFSTGIEHIKALNAKHWELVDEKLERLGDSISVVDTKVTKTNGSVLKHEKQLNDLEKLLPHTAESCPQKEIIQSMYEAYIENRGAGKMNKGYRTVLTVVLTAIGTIIGVLTYLKLYS